MSMNKIDLNRALKVFFSNALKIGISNPSQAFSFFKTILWLGKAAHLRAKWKREKIHVPPIIIFSITDQCNMECKGCYDRAIHTSDEKEINSEKLRSIIHEAKELGVSFFVIAGGEPFLRPEFLDITKDFPQIIFLIFTNGILIESNEIDTLKKQKNVIPLLSFDGSEMDTDERRGVGTFQALRKILNNLKEEGIFFGTSLTLTRSNFSTILEPNYIKDFVQLGNKFFLFLEYTPIEQGTDDWVLSDEQRDQVSELLNTFRKKFPALFIAVPWDEEDVGGCLSAGRGFVHINAQGDLEPCPFAPFSDTNLKEQSLRDGLQSEFLKEIRKRPELARETGGGCVLWKERELVASLLKNHNKKTMSPNLKVLNE